MNKNTSPILKLIISTIIVLLIVLSLHVCKYIISFINNPELFRKWISSFGLFTPIVYLVIASLQILIPMIPGEPIEMIAGYAFNVFEGTLLCFIGESFGSIVTIYLVRKYGKKVMEIFFTEEKIKALNFLHTSKFKIALVSILFIMSGTPKDLLCYFVGLTDINIKMLYLLASIGRIPSILCATLAGDLLGQQSYKRAIVILTISSILSLIGVFIFNEMKKIDINK